MWFERVAGLTIAPPTFDEVRKELVTKTKTFACSAYAFIWLSMGRNSSSARHGCPRNLEASNNTRGDAS